MSTRELLDFLDRSPSSFHAVWNMKNELINNGFTELDEKERWNIVFGGKYFVTRNDSALIAFVIPQDGYEGFRIAASHSDSPTFKIKENPEITVENKYVKLNTEGYGGMILSSWLVSPLSVAGRVIVKEEGKVVSMLVNVD